MSFAAKVVKPGRIFLRRLIDLSTTVKKLRHHISLNREALADISWWLSFLPSWNGIAFFQEDFISSEDLFFFTDASKLGIGGVLYNKWFSAEWPSSFHTLDINFQEMFAIYAALTIWAPLLSNKQIIVHCDNLDVVTIWSKGTTKHSHIMHLIRLVFFICASHNINLIAKHIPGSYNILADSLSRLQVRKFRKLHPSAETEQRQIPTSI